VLAGLGRFGAVLQALFHDLQPGLHLLEKAVFGAPPVEPKGRVAQTLRLLLEVDLLPMLLRRGCPRLNSASGRSIGREPRKPCQKECNEKSHPYRPQQMPATPPPPSGVPTEDPNLTVTYIVYTLD
jgi:hypothetical protein